MTLTRDSIVLWVGMIGALLTAVANQAGVFPPDWYPYINMAALACATICGWLKTSPLPGENDATKVNVSKTTIAKVLLPFIVWLAVSTAACGPPKTIVTEPGRRAWYAAQVLQRVGELQAVTIQLEAKHVITTDQARPIIEYCVTTAQVLKVAPEGWEKTALAGYRAFVVKLPSSVTTNPTLATALAVLEGVLVTLAGGGA